MVDRTVELRSLTHAIDEAGQGRGGVIFVAGDAGVGKSRLVREGASIAASRGFHVLIGRAADSAVPVPFRPLGEALLKVARAGVRPDRPELAHYRPALGTLVPEWSQPGDGAIEVSPLILGEGIIRLLTQRDSPGMLLVLEDVHWADPETLTIIEYLADNLSHSNLLCVATVRNSEPSAGLDASRSMNSRRVANVVELRRLNSRAIETMARACLDIDEVPPSLRTLLSECDGLPFAVEEMLAAAVASGQLMREGEGWRFDNRISTGVPASIAGSVRNRLANLAPAVSDVLTCAAVLGKKFEWTLLPDIAGLAERDVLAALRQAQDVQLIEPIRSGTGLFRFRHNLTRRAILSDLIPPARSELSARAAAAIERAHPGLPGAWCELAAELHEAAGERRQAARLLLQAGRHALAQGALSTAAGMLGDARSMLTEPSGDVMLAIQIDQTLVDALAQAGKYSEMVSVADRAIALLDAVGADRRHQAMIMITVARTRCDEHCGSSAARLAAARQIADRLHDTALASRVDAADAHCAIEAGDLDRADKLAHQALASAEEAGLRGWAADVAFEALEVIGRRERLRDIDGARAAFERAAEIATAGGFAIKRITALHELGTIEMLTDGRTGHLREAGELAHEAGAISTAMMIDLQLANTWSLGTDLDRALDAARQCEHGASQIAAHRVEAIAINLQALVAAIRGDRREATRIAERAERVVPGDPEIMFSTWGLTRVTSSLLQDDTRRALRESETALAHGGDTVLMAPRRAWGLYAILQAVFDKDGRGAIDQAHAAGAVVGWNAGYLAYAEAVLEGRRGHRDLATELAAEAYALLAPYASWWNHVARRLVAPAAFGAGWGQPADWMRDAAVSLEATGHRRLASACRGILRQAGEQVPRSGRGQAQVPPQMRRLGITSREMDVLLLVAMGLSNAEIARRLFISPKTVETHVARLVTKTGQTGRRELVAHAARFAES